MNTIPIIRTLPINISTRNAIVEHPFLLMRYMSESIPLGSTLGVQRVDIIVREILPQRFDLVLETLPPKGWNLRNVEGQISSS